MGEFHRRHRLLLLASLCFTCHLAFANDANITVSKSIVDSPPISPTVSPSPGICEPRSVNYITYNPFTSICFHHSSVSSESRDQITSSAPSPTVSSTGSTVNAGISSVEPASETTIEVSTPPIEQSQGDPEAEVIEDAAFLSFEDWKKKVLEKPKSEAETNMNRDAERRKGADRIRESLDALEDDGEIDIDFGAFLGNSHGDHVSTDSENNERRIQQSTGNDAQGDGGFNNEGRRNYRSKDAGKTCKERTNFASMDLGAQLLKTNPEAKSASALLSENRDVYMLNDCRAKDKFLIVELSESILVETVALANFEFFSSTFRQFQVSVSDRYPVKSDRWIDLGTFEARNSRDLQAFLVEDPRIWARYLRIEFLSHYGNEFYCPLSLLRVHGRTMIQDVLSMDQPQGNDDEGEADEVVNLLETESEVLKGDEKVVETLKDAGEPLEDIVKTAEDVSSETLNGSLNSSHILNAQDILGNISVHLTTAWNGSNTPDPLLSIFRHANTCLASERSSSDPLSISALHASTTRDAGAISENVNQTEKANVTASSTEPEAVGKVIGTDDSNSGPPANTSLSSTEIPSNYSISSQDANSTNDATAAASNKPQGTSAAHIAPPTTQESFFKSVSKRLQLLESNSTLSLKYIEDQSKILREAFSKMEKRQLGKTTSFLENLNSSVLNELLRFSQQYDQMWQSTVIELENQRVESRREIAAVSARLNMLADELVFQKRMSIVQSILLLLSLLLVVFSRSLFSGIVDVPVFQSFLTKSQTVSDGELDDDRLSRRSDSSLYTKTSLDDNRYRRRSRGSDNIATSRRSDESPPMPFSAYPEQEVPASIFSAPDTASQHPDSEPTITRGSTISGNLQRHREDSESYHQSAPADSSISGLSQRIGSAPSVFLPLHTPPVKEASNERLIRSENVLKDHLDEVNMGISLKRKGVTAVTPQLPSPPPESRRHEFNIARKPLPALPHESPLP